MLNNSAIQPIRAGGKIFVAPNEVEFKHLYEEIFKKHQYYLHLDNLQPFIIDAGAHIGLASLYFKNLFPQAKVLAFEPLPLLVDCLKQNVLFHQALDVEIFPYALADTDGQITLYHDAESDNYWSSTTSMFPGAWNLRQKTQPLQLPAVRLSPYIDRPVDILKLDIEGAETKVLQEVRPKLHLVKNILIEFHANHFNHPDRLIKILENAGFTLHITEEGKDILPRQMQWKIPRLYFIEGQRGQ